MNIFSTNNNLIIFLLRKFTCFHIVFFIKFVGLVNYKANSLKTPEVKIKNIALSAFILISDQSY